MDWESNKPLGQIYAGTDLAKFSFMNLSFDQGTLLLKELSEIRTDPRQSQSVFTKLPGVLWDERVDAFRAPGFCYHNILKALHNSNSTVIDSVSYKWKPEGKWIAPELRPYQREALCAWDLADRRGIAVFPTGGGKTRLAMAAMAKTGVSTLCLVPTRILIEQWHKEIKKFYSGKIGIYGDGQKELAPITISTFESAYRNMNQIGNRFNLLIVDEVHHFGNGIRDELLEMSTAIARLGLTATLNREETNIAKISSLVGRPICELTIGDLSGKYLADFDLFSLQLNLNLTERIAYDTDMKLFVEFHSTFRVSFPNAEWSKFARFAARSEQGREAMKALARAKKLTTFIQAKAEALESILKRHWKRRILIFTADTTTAYTIAKHYLIMPLTSKTSRKEREDVLRQFRTGELSVLVSCRVLNEGVDVPDADIAVIVGGSQGEREHIQRIGRLLRPAEGKRAVIYELICRGTMEVRQWKKRNVGLGA